MSEGQKKPDYVDFMLGEIMVREKMDEAIGTVEEAKDESWDHRSADGEAAE